MTSKQNLNEVRQRLLEIGTTVAIPDLLLVTMEVIS